MRRGQQSRADRQGELHDQRRRAVDADQERTAAAGSQILYAIGPLTARAGVNTTAMAQTEPAKKDATVVSYKIHYLEAGRGAPVILLHGMGGEGARWMPTINGLASEFR